MPEIKVGDPAEKVTPQPAAESIIHKEEKVEFRDQNGNLLNEEQVSSLEGKVSFKTRYETRTRIIDAEGKEVDDVGAGAAGVPGAVEGAAEGGIAPPHPDAERQPGTLPEVDDDKKEFPATASPEEDIGKEKSVEAKEVKAKPASEGGKATKGEL